jgi:hypothetical protein
MIQRTSTRLLVIVCAALVTAGLLILAHAAYATGAIELRSVDTAMLAQSAGDSNPAASSRDQVNITGGEAAMLAANLLLDPVFHSTFLPAIFK